MSEFFGVIFTWVVAASVLLSVVGIFLVIAFSIMRVCDLVVGSPLVKMVDDVLPNDRGMSK
jgi:hypothetical protein